MRIIEVGSTSFGYTTSRLVASPAGGIVAVALVCSLASATVHAQVTIDLSKVTCQQYVLYKVGGPEKIGLWLSGYYNGKRGNTIVSPQSFEANAAKLQDYCRRNPEAFVMQAVEAVVDMDK